MLSIGVESVYFPTNNARGFPLLHILSRFFNEDHADSLWSHGLCSWNSPGQNTGMGSLSLLQGIFPTQGSNPGLPHCRQILYQLSHQGSLSLVGKGCKAILWDLPLGALPRSQSKYWRKMPCASGNSIEKGVIFKRSYIPEPSDLGKCDIFLHVRDHCGFQFVCINQMSFTLIP